MHSSCASCNLGIYFIRKLTISGSYFALTGVAYSKSSVSRFSHKGFIG